MKGQSVLRTSKTHVYDESKPPSGLKAYIQTPRTYILNSGLGLSLILGKGFSDDISTIVLCFSELRKQWGTNDPIGQSCPPPQMGFSPSTGLLCHQFREMAKFSLNRLDPLIILNKFFIFLFFFAWLNETI